MRKCSPAKRLASLSNFTSLPLDPLGPCLSSNSTAQNPLLYLFFFPSPTSHLFISLLQLPTMAQDNMSNLLLHPFAFIYEVIQWLLDLILSPAAPKPGAQLGRPKIAIIGAGLTGVSAASHCVGHGFDVHIFEAGPREQLGGIWSVSSFLPFHLKMWERKISRSVSEEKMKLPWLINLLCTESKQHFWPTDPLYNVPLPPLRPLERRLSQPPANRIPNHATLEEILSRI